MFFFLICKKLIIIHIFRPRIKTSVECWFCRKSTKVEYQQRNSFTCPSCEQYNGFTEDGDYNRRIPGQAWTTPKRYCEPGKMQSEKPSTFLDRFGGVNMSPSEFNILFL